MSKMRTGGCRRKGQIAIHIIPTSKSEVNLPGMLDETGNGVLSGTTSLGVNFLRVGVFVSTYYLAH